ncbi:NUP49 (YGL172W) [Zygosaccharomyces parabailii]|nr:NUP49 (YGL172W) [Zygosaccharomyces parabailii]
MFNFGKSASAGAGSSGGMFGQNNTAGSTGVGGGFNFGQSNNNNGNSGGFSFGNQNQNSTASGGLFGTKPANSGAGGTGFTFGKPAQNSTSGSLFGSNQSGNDGSGGLFSATNSNTSNTLFGGNNNSNTNGGGSFGNTNNNNGSGGLFGNSGSANTTASGLFGNNNNASTSGGGGLFGNKNTNSNNGGLFGTSSNNTGSGGLFSNNTGSGGLFGNKSTTSTGASGATGGLFGAKPAGNSTFGNNSNSTGSLFGNNANNSINSGSLFGNNSNTTTGGLFGSKPTGSSLFGNNISSNNGGLLGAQNVSPQLAINSISQLPITTITRIADLPPQLRQEIEQLDQYIQRQVQISQHLKADTPEHKELIGSVPRDIAYLLKSETLANQSLAQDLKKLNSIKETTDYNLTDTQTFSIILQQLLTPGSKISSLELDKFFHHKLQSYKCKLDEYFRVLSDIESAVNGIDSDIFGSRSEEFQGSNSNDSLDVFAVKTGLNALVSTVVEEFQLFMDTAEKIAELHQKVKQAAADRLTTQ